MADEVTIFKKIPEIVGWLSPIIVAFTVWLTGRKKNDIDQSTMVLNQWKLLLEAHKTQMDEQGKLWEQKLQAQAENFALKWDTAQNELQELRTKLKTHEKRIDALEEENRQLRTENEGYRNQAIQRSRSEVQLLPPSSTARSPTASARFKDPDNDLIESLDNGAE